MTNSTMLFYGAITLLVLLSLYWGYNFFFGKKDGFNANREGSTGENSSSGSTKSAQEKTATFIIFVASWCPWSKSALPEWEKFQAEYDGKIVNGYRLEFVTYECGDPNSEASAIATKYDVEGYPTIKLLKDDRVIDFDAKPTQELLTQFLQTTI
jgi:thiol-disulfide isomerase/thioredoxin